MKLDMDVLGLRARGPPQLAGIPVLPEVRAADGARRIVVAVARALVRALAPDRGAIGGGDASPARGTRPVPTRVGHVCRKHVAALD